MWDSIQAFIQGCAGLTDEAVLFRKLETTAGDVGYPYWAFGALWGDRAAYHIHPPPAVRLNYPPAWIQRYFAAGFDKIDPVVQLTPYVHTSVSWDELRHYRPDFFDEAAAFGLGMGLSVPLRGVQGTYVLCFARPEADAIMATERIALEVLAHGFFTAYLRVRDLQPVQHDLSENTIEVIRLSLAGLSPKDVATRLDLSVAGVYWCLKDAKKKLQCSNQAQLYLKAIQSGIVAI